MLVDFTNLEVCETNMADTSERLPLKQQNVEVSQPQKKKPAPVFIYDFAEKKSNSCPNLQEAFLKFRKSRQDEVRLSKLMKERQLAARADPNKMMDLRMKFLNQCKKYFGVPYAKKYWKPEEPEYYSRLFLDCCGLVRQVLRDLEEDFGFRIGPWNQAYMYDLLPITVEKEEDMKPGDLVFISATYYNPKSKRQRHDMTHVEVWLGDGPKTIGARWQRGKVQVFDSYAFEAKSYHSQKYLFKSIDTWLMGICQSYCPDHPWARGREFDPSQRSVFALEGGHEDDEDAGDTDDEMINSFGDERDFKKLLEKSDSNTEADIAQELSGMSVKGPTKSAKPAKSCHEKVVDLSDKENSPGGDTPCDADSPGQGGNGGASGNSGSSNNSNNRGRRKAGKKTPDEGGGSNGDGGGGGANGGTAKPPKIGMTSAQTPTFYIGGGNGVALVQEPLEEMGWKRITDKHNDFFKLKWTESKSAINYQAFRDGEQLVNHIPNGNLITNKLGLVKSLLEHERVSTAVRSRGPRMSMSDFFPETFKLDERKDREAFFNTYKDGEIWICKPTGMNQGKGIYLVRDIEQFKKSLDERDERIQARRSCRPPGQQRIIQRYIHNPLLLDQRKFDIRTYMLIASTQPYLLLYHKGYVRLSCQTYDTESQDLTTHLTNQYVQKKDPNYQDVKEDTAWSMDKFNDYINTEVAPEKGIEEDWVYNSLTKQMQRIMIHIFNAVKHKLHTRVGYFDLYGLDFMVDQDMKTYLIEVNVNPALHTNCEALKEVIPDVVKETLHVAIECFEKARKNNSITPLRSLKNFTVLYNGETGRYISLPPMPRTSNISPVESKTTLAETSVKEETQSKGESKDVPVITKDDVVTTKVISSPAKSSPAQSKPALTAATTVYQFSRGDKPKTPVPTKTVTLQPKKEEASTNSLSQDMVKLKLTTATSPRAVTPGSRTTVKRTRSRSDTGN